MTLRVDVDDSALRKGPGGPALDVGAGAVFVAAELPIQSAAVERQSKGFDLLVAVGLGSVSAISAVSTVGFFIAAVLDRFRMSWTNFAIFLPLLLLMALASVRSARRLMPRRVGVGSDGIALRDADGKRRFVPIASIERVEHLENSVRVHCTGGTSVLLPTAPGGELLGQRIEEAMAARGNGGSASLDRGQRSAAEWRARLRVLASSDEGYREVAVTVTDLCDVLDDGAAAPERRIAAALALSSTDAELARRRVRIAAQASTDEELRSALESAAEGEVDLADLDSLARRHAKLCGIR